MLAQQVGKKYGGALYRLALDRNLIDQAWEQFEGLAVYLSKDNTFLNYMMAPQIPDEKKVSLIKSAFEKQFEKPFFNFLMVLMRKRRIKYLMEIIDEFDRLVRVKKGIARVTCITTAPVAEADRKKLVDRLAAKTGLKIELESKIDKAIIGGMIVILPNQIIDGSIRHGLELLRNRLMRVKVN